MTRQLTLLGGLYGTAFVLTALVFSDYTLPLDTSILRGINSLSTPWLDTFFKAFTHLGEPFVLTGFSFVVFGVLIQRKRIRAAIIFAAAMLGTSAVNISLKYYFMRVRPELWQVLTPETTFSFPSGHAMGTASLALILAYLSRRHPRRRIMYAGLAILVIMIGLSRLYLGVHYPSDVVAGWLYSAAWVGTAVVAGKRLAKH